MKKKFLFYIGHPAHFYNFSIISKKLLKENHDVLLVVRDRNIVIDLVKKSNFNYILIKNKKKGNSKLSLIWSILYREYIIFKIVLKYKPDIMAGTDIVITHIGKLFKIPSIILCDDDSSVIPMFAALGMRFATAVVCPNICNIDPYDNKKIGYSGLQKSTYLNPKYFKPNKDFIKDYIDLNKKYFIIRVVELTAHHDDGINGINDIVLEKIINKLEPYGNIYISSERVLPSKYKKFSLNIPVDKIHHAMSYSDLFISDSQSMTVECCLLGVPSIRFSDFVGKISVLEELESKYKLTYGILPKDHNKLLETITNLLDRKSNRIEWLKKRDKMLDEMVDVSEFIYNVLIKYTN